MNRDYYIYLLTNKNKSVLYIGVTGDISLRVTQHKLYKGSKFTSLYNVNILIYAEWFEDIEEAITREKQLKKWSRSKKEWLIDQVNPDWNEIEL